MLFRGLSPAASAAGAGDVMQPKALRRGVAEGIRLGGPIFFRGAFLHIFFVFWVTFCIYIVGFCDLCHEVVFGVLEHSIFSA